MEPGNDQRPDKVGQRKMIDLLRINAVVANGARILRVSGWLQALVVSEQFKDVVESSGNAMTTFEAVS